jgi:bifunctional non-homologous end joining protein LigD
MKRAIMRDVARGSILTPSAVAPQLIFRGIMGVAMARRRLGQEGDRGVAQGHRRRIAVGMSVKPPLASPPKWIEPCIPTLIAKPPKGPNWRHEIKWDGYRISIVINDRKAKVRTRKGLDWTEKFWTIADDAAKLKCRNAIIDGEAVVLDDKGRANFSVLQASLADSGENVIAYVFDLLFLDGRDLRALPLGERRKALEKLIGKGSGAILLSEQVDADGEAFFATAREHGLEGIVSKRIDLPYRSGRRSDWLRIKSVQADTFVIVGYMPDGRGRIAHLLLAAEEDEELRYVGAVGTGWSEAEGLALKKRLDALTITQAGLEGVMAKGAVWIHPSLGAKIEYRGLTSGGELRQAAFKGLRQE